MCLSWEKGRYIKMSIFLYIRTPEKDICIQGNKPTALKTVVVSSEGYFEYYSNYGYSNACIFKERIGYQNRKYNLVQKFFQFIHVIEKEV